MTAIKKTAPARSMFLGLSQSMKGSTQGTWQDLPVLFKLYSRSLLDVKEKMAYKKTNK
jgi:hypothetical protein